MLTCDEQRWIQNEVSRRPRGKERKTIHQNCNTSRKAHGGAPVVFSPNVWVGEEARLGRGRLRRAEALSSGFRDLGRRESQRRGGEPERHAERISRVRSLGGPSRVHGER